MYSFKRFLRKINNISTTIYSDDDILDNYTISAEENEHLLKEKSESLSGFYSLEKIPKRDSFIEEEVSEEVETMIKDILGNKRVESVIKNRKHLLTVPSVIQSFMVISDKDTKKAAYYKELDYSLFFENRIALLAMIFEVNCHKLFSNKVYNRARKIYELYFKNPICLYRHNYLTYYTKADYLLEEVYSGKELNLSLKVGKVNYYHGVIENEDVDLFYEMMEKIPLVEINDDMEVIVDIKQNRDSGRANINLESYLSIISDCENYRLSVCMDAIRQHNDDEVYVLFHIELVDAKNAKAILLDKNESTHPKYVDELLLKYYNDKNVLAFFANPFALKSAKNKTSFDDISSELDCDFGYSDVAVKVGGFGGTYQYNTFFPVNIGDKVYVDHAKSGEIGEIKTIIGPINPSLYASVVKVVGKNYDLEATDFNNAERNYQMAVIEDIDNVTDEMLYRSITILEFNKKYKKSLDLIKVYTSFRNKIDIGLSDKDKKIYSIMLRDVKETFENYSDDYKVKTFEDYIHDFNPNIDISISEQIEEDNFIDPVQIMKNKFNIVKHLLDSNDSDKNEILLMYVFAYLICENKEFDINFISEYLKINKGKVNDVYQKIKIKSNYAIELFYENIYKILEKIDLVEKISLTNINSLFFKEIYENVD